MSSSFVRRLAVLLGLLALAAAPSAASAKRGPVIKSFSAALAWSLANPDLDPAGTNHWGCKPSAQHPRPVVLLHGTYANRFNSFAAMAPAIRQQGYCVFALDYGQGLVKGVGGAGAIRKSSREVAAFVDQVLAATGASQVDLVGYSQGGLVARSYLRYDGGANPADPARNKVASLTGLSVANHGTLMAGAVKEVRRLNLTGLVRVTLGDAAVDQFEGSGFLTELNGTPGGETVAGVRSTMIGTTLDEISVPHTQSFLTAGPGGAAQNITLQQGCPLDASDHFNLTYSPRAIALTLRALDPAFRGRIPCTVQLPVV